MKLSIDNLELYIGKITIVIYWPTMKIGKRMINIEFNSQFIFHNKKTWAWNKSMVLRIIGFGLGIAHNHCDNPNYIYIEI